MTIAAPSVAVSSRPAIAHDSSVAEVRSLTGLRGVAALYVVFYHFFSPLSLTSPSLCFFGHGYLSVDLFFVLSGFVMTMNYASLFASGLHPVDVWRFLARRLARIYPLYLLSLLFATALVLTGLLDFNGRSIAQTFGANVLMIQNWGNWESMQTPAWSISTEWFAYLLFPFVLRLLAVRFRAISALLAFLSVAGLVWLSLRGAQHFDPSKVLDFHMGYQSLVRCSAEFILGILAFRVGSSHLGHTLKKLNWLPVLVASAISCLLFFRGTDVVVVLLVPLLILSLENQNTLPSHFLGSRVLEFLGLISFSVYLLHYLFVPLLNGLHSQVSRLGFEHNHSYAVAVVFPLLLLCATASYYFVELPARKAMRTLLDPVSRAT